MAVAEVDHALVDAVDGADARACVGTNMSVLAATVG